MGNRANVVFVSNSMDLEGGMLNDASPAIYLHWNGGPESVYAFLKEMDRRDIRSGDLSYEAARFAQIVGDFFDQDERGTLSVGILPGPTEPFDTGDGVVSKPSVSDRALEPLDHGDNGVYLVNRNKRTCKRYGGYGKVLLEGTLERAYKILAKDKTFVGISQTFLDIDEKLYA